MTQEEIDGLKPGDAIYHISCNSDGTRIYIRDSSTLYVRGLGRGLNVSHSQSWNAAQWPTDGREFLSDNYCLKENLEKTALKIATRVLSDRLSRAEQVFKEAKAEFEAIGETTPNSMIDFESLKNAK